MSWIIIYLVLPLPTESSSLPESMDGPPTLCSVLLRMGFTCALSVTRKAVVSYTALPPLPAKLAVHFCCTFLGVASTGRYPASCPVEPGLSSPAPLRLCSRDYLFYLLFSNSKKDISILTHSIHLDNNFLYLEIYTSKTLPPINSLTKEFFGTSSLLTPKK